MRGLESASGSGANASALTPVLATGDGFRRCTTAPFSMITLRLHVGADVDADHLGPARALPAAAASQKKRRRCRRCAGSDARLGEIAGDAVPSGCAEVCGRPRRGASRSASSCRNRGGSRPGTFVGSRRRLTISSVGSGRTGSTWPAHTGCSSLTNAQSRAASMGG